MSIVLWLLFAISGLVALAGLVAGFAGLASGLALITGVGLTRDAPFLVRLGGLQHWMTRYLTPDGVKLRNRTIKLWALFLLAWCVGFGSIMLAKYLEPSSVIVYDGTNLTMR